MRMILCKFDNFRQRDIARCYHLSRKYACQFVNEKFVKFKIYT